MRKEVKSMVSKKVNQCKASATLLISEKERRYQEDGIAVISFGTGEPDFFTPDYICEGAKRAIDSRHTKYDAVSGLYALRQAISKKLREDNGLDYSPEQIILSSGAKASLSIALQTILNPGDEVILPSPFWVSYDEIIRLAGGVAVIAETDKENNFKLTPKNLIYAITPKTKALILNTPTNPTGSVYSLEELLKLSEILIRNKIITISDEIYEHYVYDKNQHISIASLNKEIKNLTILINGFSKSYAMTGWRLGYAGANKEIIDGMKKVQGHLISHPSTITQYAGLTALEEKEKDEFLDEILESFIKRRKKMMDHLNQINDIDYIVPEGAFYIFVDLTEFLENRKNVINPNTSIGFCEKLLEEKKVIAIPGEAFGKKNYIRLSFATSLEEIDEGMKRMAEFIQNY